MWFEVCWSFTVALEDISEVSWLTLLILCIVDFVFDESFRLPQVFLCIWSFLHCIKGDGRLLAINFWEHELRAIRNQSHFVNQTG
jgi:hypothetical protein